MTTATLSLSAGPVDPKRRGYLQNTWLRSFKEELQAADDLLRLASKRKEGREKDALFKGYFAVLRTFEETVKYATEVGGLPLLWEGSAALKRVGS